ncbi:hypothetical protein EYF80_047194 [Liparis tanakae]|uniref:Uncharacterized protein n=1 Tax=Liparis tanakae TaxID=230148 RepID=A0A4Z2FMY8_9TELE|nr:hypothetical protein EYF80_047194 [Liparis tanakae]
MAKRGRHPDMRNPTSAGTLPILATSRDMLFTISETRPHHPGRVRCVVPSASIPRRSSLLTEMFTTGSGKMALSSSVSRVDQVVLGQELPKGAEHGVPHLQLPHHHLSFPLRYGAAGFVVSGHQRVDVSQDHVDDRYLLKQILSAQLLLAVNQTAVKPACLRDFRDFMWDISVRSASGGFRWLNDVTTAAQSKSGRPGIIYPVHHGHLTHTELTCAKLIPDQHSLLWGDP